MKILISAAESSSDVHAAELVKEIKSHYRGSDPLELFGVGGPKLLETGFKSVVPFDSLRIMGVFEALSKLIQLRRSFNKILEEAKARRPDVAVLLDFPEFHIKLANKLHALGIPVIYYIPPKIWVWRSYRIKKLKRYFVKILSILPFEQSFYSGAGVPFRYVGNPLADELKHLPSQSDLKKQFSIHDGDCTLTFMPGSRDHEVKHHLGLGLKAIQNFFEKKQAKGLTARFRVFIPLPPGSDLNRFNSSYASVLSPEKPWNFELVISAGNSAECMLASDLGLIKSGTSTLEAAVLGCPHVIFYRGNRLTEILFKWIVNYKGPVGLSNLFIGEQLSVNAVYPELLAYRATSDELCAQLTEISENVEKRNKQKKANSAAQKLVFAQGSPSETAALEVLQTANDFKNRPDIEMRKNILLTGAIRLASFIWSFVNWVRRALHRVGVIKSKQLPSKVIGVGNIQAGGAGKTPVVIKIAKEAVRAGKVPAILIRGYGGNLGHSNEIILPGCDEYSPILLGDEAVLIHNEVPEAWIGVGRNRHASYEKMKSLADVNFDLVILDDSFQNYQIKKDIEIVLVTSNFPGQVLFRDFQSSLKFCDHVIWTKGRRIPYVPIGVDLQVAEYELDVSKLNSEYHLISAIGDSSYLLAQLDNLGVKLRSTEFFPDHYQYNETQIESWLNRSKEDGLGVLTTGKDWAKLKQFPILTRSDRIKFSVIEPNFKEGKDLFWERILSDTSSA